MFPTHFHFLSYGSLLSKLAFSWQGFPASGHFAILSFLVRKLSIYLSFCVQIQYWPCWYKKVRLLTCITLAVVCSVIHSACCLMMVKRFVSFWRSSNVYIGFVFFVLSFIIFSYISWNIYMYNRIARKTCHRHINFFNNKLSYVKLQKQSCNKRDYFGYDTLLSFFLSVLYPYFGVNEYVYVFILLIWL